VYRHLGLLWLSCVCVNLLHAQSSGDRYEIFGGYSLVTNDFTGIQFDNQRHLMNGWSTAFTYKPVPLFGITADVSGYRVSSSNSLSAHSLNFLFGPTLSLPLSRVTPFAHILFGPVHVSYPNGCRQCSGTSAFSYALGGGADFFFTKHVGLRGQVDFFHNGISSLDNQLDSLYHQNTARITTGLALRF